jgi:hypothetical protein
MCLGCSARLRREWNLRPIQGPAARFGSGLELVRVAAMAVMVVSVVLAARPLDDVRPLRAMTPPPQTVLVPVPVDEEVMPSLAVADAPRRALPPRAVDVSSPRASPPASVELSRPPGVPYPSRILVASLPHAGLTPQTP